MVLTSRGASFLTCSYDDNIHIVDCDGHNDDITYHNSSLAFKVSGLVTFNCTVATSFKLR